MLVKPDEIDFSQWAYADESNRIFTPEQVAGEVEELLFHPVDVARGLRLPWKSSHGLFGIRGGEVTLWHGNNGHGKSLLVGQAVLGLMRQGEKCVVLSMEIEPAVTLYRMERQAIADHYPATLEMHGRFIRWATGKLWLYARTGMVDIDTALAVMNYCQKTLGVTQIVVDSLMKLGMGVDDYTAQKIATARLCDFAMARKCHIHLVVHSRKPVDSDEKKPSKYDIKGAGDISDQADNVLNVWRHRKKERVLSGEVDGDRAAYQNAADAQVICDKQRHFAWEGAVKLWFDRRSLQFVDNVYGNPMDVTGMHA